MSGTEDGASEIDMVINLGMVKNQQYPQVTEEIRLLEREATGDKILKVIIETCYLTEEEKNPDVRSSDRSWRGFYQDLNRIRNRRCYIGGCDTDEAACGPNVKIKAAGGIRSKEDMELYIGAGCSRIGTSSAIAMLQDGE